MILLIKIPTEETPNKYKSKSNTKPIDNSRIRYICMKKLSGRAIMQSIKTIKNVDFQTKNPDHKSTFCQNPSLPADYYLKFSRSSYD